MDRGRGLLPSSGSLDVLRAAALGFRPSEAAVRFRLVRPLGRCTGGGGDGGRRLTADVETAAVASTLTCAEGSDNDSRRNRYLCREDEANKCDDGGDVHAHDSRRKKNSTTTATDELQSRNAGRILLPPLREMIIGAQVCKMNVAWMRSIYQRWMSSIGSDQSAEGARRRGQSTLTNPTIVVEGLQLGTLLR
jgi:hypothetical protein